MTGIPAEELQRWRRDVWGDGDVSQVEADQLFDLNDRVGESGDGEWADFFVEALIDFLVRGGQPRGYVTDDQADWLIRRIGSAGQIDNASELRLIDHLFERADFVPTKLKAFALDAIEKAVLSGRGPTRDGAGDSGAISDAEVKLLRRFVFAPAGDGPAYVTRPEAELLWRLKDGSVGQTNAAEWMTLFVQALGNHLLASPKDDLSDRQTALKHEAYLTAPASGLGEFLARMASSRPDFAGAIGAVTEDQGKAYGGRLDATDDGLDPEERQWTEGKVCEDGAIDHFEQALLEFVVR
ncbi:MAG: hypothetical protein ABIO29_03695 [Sphingomicrobium sp.]